MSEIQNLIQSHKKQIKQDRYKYLGFTCIYAPEEIITAAGLVPYRITGDARPTPLADRELQVNICGFARSCFELALQGDYNFLQGVVIPTTCDTFTKLYDIWRYNTATPFTFQLSIPHVISERAQKFYQQELAKLIETLENTFDCTIDEDSLNNAIEIHNTNRTLLHQLSELRKSRPPRIKGSEMLSLVLASMVMPREESNKLLSEALALLQTRELPASDDVIRVMVTGAPLDDLRLFNLVEKAGAQIVYDDTCTGSRYFRDKVKPSSSPLEALARRYLSKVPCPCMLSGDITSHLRQHIDDFQAEGVIIYSLKFCDPHLHQAPELAKAIRGWGLPSLLVESDHASVADGQLTTRVEAFLETISNKR